MQHASSVSVSLKTSKKPPGNSTGSQHAWFWWEIGLRRPLPQEMPLSFLGQAPFLRPTWGPTRLPVATCPSHALASNMSLSNQVQMFFDDQPAQTHLAAVFLRAKPSANTSGRRQQI